MSNPYVPLFILLALGFGFAALSVFTRTELEHELWGEEHPQSDSLRSHMHMLRRALTDAQGHAPIETVHGVGFRLAALVT